MKQFENHHQVPLPMALWLTTDEYKYAQYANELSATTILRSPRYIIGSRRTMYPEQFGEHLRPIPVALTEGDLQLPDIQDRIASRVGTAIHDSIEKAWKESYRQGLDVLGYPQEMIDRVVINPETVNEGDIPVYFEQRLYKEIEVDGMKFTISGQFDSIINGNLHDIKTTSTYSYETGVNDEKYMLQGSIYRWLNPEMITGDELTINFLFMDWKKFQKGDKYPPAKAYFKKYQLMSIQETEMYIINKLKQLVKYWNSPLEIIPCCTEKELFSKPPVFKYYKTGFAEGKRATKNFNTFTEASAFRAKNNFQGDIVEYKGDPFYCQFCNPTEVEQLQTTISKENVLDIG